MPHQIRSLVSHLSNAALVAAMLLFASAWTPAYSDSAEVLSLLQQARTSAAELSRDASTMDTFGRSRVSWNTHVRQIDLIKQHINRAGKILSDLHAARDTADPWQQHAIDRITPLLQEMASNTESIINHLNQGGQTWHPEYVDYLRSNSVLSSDLSKLIGDYVDYGNAKGRTQELETRLGF